MNFVPNIVLLGASIADILTTLFGLAVGCLETNPLVASVGWINVLVGKVIATLFVVFVLRSQRDRLGGLAFVPGLVVTLIVLWNILNVAAQLV